jgi:GH35 family endo-1,4-beta-xylanase
VQIVQKKHQFRFGTAIASDPLFSKTLDGDKYREAIRNYFNCVVFENQMKWAGEDWFPPGTADRMLKWCEAYRLPVRGHCLLWANYEHLPKAKQGLRGEALRKAIQDHVTDYATRYKGKVYVWDAVNEAVTNRQIIEELGGEGILAETFQWARKADPKARLAYNEFDILNNQAGAHDAHRAAAAGVLKRLLAAKAPINALGIQAHMKLPLTPGYKLEAILNEWAQFGLPIEITEYDLTVTDDAVHAAYLKEFMTAVFSHPAVDSFVMWGFWEGAHWLAEQGGAMIRKDWTLRPAMQVYQDLVFKQWRTNAQGKTNEQGEVSFRVFFGDHEIAALKDNLDSRGTIRVERKGDAAQTVTIRLQ